MRLSLLALCIVLLAACGSPKGSTRQKTSAVDTLGATYTAYSQKLGITVDKTANLKLMQLCVEWYGVPYQFGQCSKGGVDCSGFAQMIYKEVYGKTLKRTSLEQYEQCTKIKQEELKEGDLVFFKTKGKKVSHVGVYLRERKFAHASTSKGVMVSGLDETYWKDNYTASGRP